MTTNNESKQKRVSGNPALEISSKSKLYNTEDPSSEYPKSEYFYSLNVNKAATGGKRNDLWIGGGEAGLGLDLGEVKSSQYPYNQVDETLSGHVMEFDDTPGNERVLIKHRSGSGVELRADGSVVVSAVKNRVEVVGDDHKFIVEGDGNLVYKGNLKLKVDGDFDVDCNNYNVNVRGGMNVNVSQSLRTTIRGNLGETVKGTSSRTSIGSAVNTFLGGQSNNVKGTFSNNVDGPANYVSSEDAVITSQTNLNMSSVDVNIAADNLSVFGDEGTIGGENIIMYNYNMHTGHTVWSETVSADTFHGDLNGTAKQSNITAAQNYADPDAGGGTSGSAYSYTETALDTKATALPTGTLLDGYLNRSAGGIRVVDIDVGDHIKNFVDRSTAYGGVDDAPATTGVVRSRTRDPVNRNNQAYVGSAISEGVVSPGYSRPSPTGIGRVVKGNSTPKIGQIKIGNVKMVSQSDPFIPRNVKVNLVPDPIYNPLFKTDITSKTKLAPGVYLSKFLGAKDHPTSLDFMKDLNQRKQLAKYLYLHGEIIRSIQTNQAAFKDFRLIVSEGVYRPGPTETITAGELNDLKLKGRLVIYDLVDKDGLSDPTNIFDLAEYWKDTLYFDKLILFYDTYDTDKDIAAQIGIILPEIDDNWSGVFNREVETRFNNEILSRGELVECLSIPSTQNNTLFVPKDEDTGTGYRGKIGGATKGLDAKLLKAMEAAARAVRVDLIVSSGFRGSGSNPSGRHAGFAADTALYSGGKQLTVEKSGDLSIIRNFCKAFIDECRNNNLVPSIGAANTGIDPKTGVQYPLYMGGNYFHFDIARTPGIGASLSPNAGAYWGGSGARSRHVPAPNWLTSLF